MARRVAAATGGHALLMTWPIAREGKYPAYKGAHALFWIAEEYLELEPLSAEILLDEGQSAGFTVAAATAAAGRSRRRSASCGQVAGAARGRDVGRRPCVIGLASSSCAAACRGAQFVFRPR
jgi:hypothetical protein